MSWYLDFKKYKKQIKELLFVRSELEYQEELLSETHPIFEDYYRKFCVDNRIDLVYLNKNNEKKVEGIFEGSEKKKDKLIHKPRKKKDDSTKSFDRIYREIAKQVHPDKLSDSLPEEEITEKEEMFKQASEAIEKGDWGRLLEVADWLNIKPRHFEGIEKLVKSEINKLKQLIENNKNMYSWEFAQCETDHERDEVVVRFLFHLFGYIVDNSD